MKKNILYKIALFSVALLTTVSCVDLDQQPDERVNIEDSEENVVDLLTTAYSVANYGWICEISSDNFMDNNAPHYPANANADQTLVHYNLNAYDRGDDELFRFDACESNTSTDSPTYVWTAMYNAIATANHALEAINKIVEKNDGVMSETMKAAYGEAMLTRAYHHFILVNIFSQAYKNEEASKQDIGVPYVTEPETKVLVDYDRSNVADVYDKIEADLIEGLKYVSDINYEKPKWHFNVKAANAFAAKFYLFKRDYDKAIEYANNVLGTDRSQLSSQLMDYSGFDDCTYSEDYANVWQSPDLNNNLMLMATYSTAWRRSAGYRYAVTGLSLRQIMYHTGVNYGWTIIPASVVSGGTFYRTDSDYGFVSSKIAETFQYTDKVAGIGYCHVIRRELTASDVLLIRAEAELLCSQHDVESCVADLIAYDDSRQNFSETNKTYYSSNGRGMHQLTKSEIENYYSKSANSNVYTDWSFTQNMSSDFIIPDNLIPYMNCINDFRRYETSYEGLRFFDLKRWGIEYSHKVGLDNVEYKLTWNDPRRAIEVPAKAISAGLETSRPTTTPETGDDVAKRNTDLQKEIR